MNSLPPKWTSPDYAGISARLRSLGHLYRYRPVEREEHLKWIRDSLTMGDHWCSCPEGLNDPFEFSTRLDFSGTKDEVIAAWRASSEISKLAPEAQVRALEAGLERSKNHDQWPALEAAMHKIAKEVGVLCLNEAPDCVLSWSHYAEAHKGIWMRFTMEPATPWAPVPLAPFRVRYTSEFSTVRVYEIGFEKAVHEIVGAKAKFWEYEREWRLIRVAEDGGEGLVRIPHECITGICFGMRTRKDIEKEIRGWALERNPGMEFFRARKRPYEYALDIVPE